MKNIDIIFLGTKDEIAKCQPSKRSKKLPNICEKGLFELYTQRRLLRAAKTREVKFHFCSNLAETGIAFRPKMPPAGISVYGVPTACTPSVLD